MFSALVVWALWAMPNDVGLGLDSKAMQALQCVGYVGIANASRIVP